MSIIFGEYYGCYYIFNWLYNNICEKINNFLLQAGPDRYERNMNAEPIIDFAIRKSITDKSAEYIYRHFVYDKIEKTGFHFNKDEEEISDMKNSFIFIE